MLPTISALVELKSGRMLAPTGDMYVVGGVRDGGGGETGVEVGGHAGLSVQRRGIHEDRAAVPGLHQAGGSLDVLGFSV